MPPRTRPAEATQRPVPRHQRTASGESDPLRHRPKTERSPRLLTDRRSPRGSQSDPLAQKKLGTRISDLETQLVQAQCELKNLKQHLSSGDDAKKDARARKPKKSPTAAIRVEKEEVSEETHKETDVFEVPMQEASIESKPDLEEDQCDLEKPILDEIEQLKCKLSVKEKENDVLKEQLNEANAVISAGVSKEEELATRCRQLEKDLEACKAVGFELKEKLEDVEAGKEELEAEMKKLRIQTEQWRKAADAAAAVLAGGVEMGGGRVPERGGGVLEKHFNGMFELPPPPSAVPGFLPSPPGDDMEDEFGGKKKGSGGMRLLGDLWKKKGHK